MLAVDFSFRRHAAKFLRELLQLGLDGLLCNKSAGTNCRAARHDEFSEQIRVFLHRGELLVRDADVVRVTFRRHKMPAQLHGRHGRRARAAKRIEHQPAPVGREPDDSLHQFFRQLTRMRVAVAFVFDAMDVEPDVGQVRPCHRRRAACAFSHTRREDSISVSRAEELTNPSPWPSPRLTGRGDDHVGREVSS